ncbi:unnamed protein product [Somion occarium]|uniref:Flavin-containing monooxygenase n=1 Tax=Somion occarium TaxID=3059160 RepID=A0ABP1DAG4_9APHY
MKVVIVGAGPAGLVTCKTLLEASSTELPFDPIVLEQDDDVGGAFRTRWYEDANLVSSKQLTAFSDFRFSSSDLDHLPLEQYVDYLRAYSKNFRIEERIQFNSRVVNIRRAPEGGHFISYVRKRTDGSGQWQDSPTVIHATYVAICTGLLTMPAVPDIPGIENILNNTTPESENAGIKPAIFHSEDYKSRSQLAGRKLLILGSGETAMDLAYGAAQVGAKEVVLCSRSGFLSFPKYLNDFEILGFQFKSNNPIPTDCLSTNFTDTAYVHPWIAASRIRWFISDFVLKWASWFLTGTQAGVNQWVGELEPKRRSRAYAFPNKSPKAMPYINRPYRNPPKTLDYFSRYIDPPEDMPPNTNFGVELAPFPSHVLPSGRVVFPVSKRKDAIRIARKDVRPDTVIYATGFKQEFNFFDPESKYTSLGERDIRDITKTGDESVGFIGFLRPGYGVLLDIIAEGTGRETTSPTTLPSTSGKECKNQERN